MAFKFGFSKEETETSTSQQTDTTRTQTQTGEQQTTGSQQEQVTTLSPEIQALLTGLTRQLAGGIREGQPAGQATEVAGLLTERAKTAEGATAADIAAIVNEQQRAGQQQITRLFTDLSQQVGSSQGSLIRQAAAEGEASLASQLAATRGGLNLQARQQATQEMLAALQGLAGAQGVEGAQVQNLAQVVNLLKGATTAGTTTTQQRTTTEQELVDIIKSLTTQQSQSESSGFDFGFGSLGK